jgi:UDP-glucose 4-epimerase
MPNVLVTGGAGFIGSHVVDTLTSEGYRVTVLDDLSGGFTDNSSKDATFVEGSILHRELLEKLFSQHRFEYVFHLAAYAAEGLSHFIKRFNYNNNLIGSVNLINLSIRYRVKCFVFTSSIAVYGANQLPMTEQMTPKPEDSYGIAKYAVEQELAVSHEMFGLPYIIFRPHNVYGERQNIGDKYRNVVGIFMNQIMQNQPMTIFGNGEQKRAFSYISDVAPVIAKSIQVSKAYNQVFNIGADIPYTVNELAQAVSESFDVAPNVQFLERRNEVDEAYCDHTKTHEYFGVQDAVSLADGLTRMSAWAKKHGARKTKDFAEIEVDQNLPRSWQTVSS